MKKKLIIIIGSLFALIVLPYIIKATMPKSSVQSASTGVGQTSSPPTSLPTSSNSSSPQSSPIKSTPAPVVPPITQQDLDNETTNCTQNQQAIAQESQTEAQMTALSNQMAIESQQYGQDNSSGLTLPQRIAAYQTKLQQEQSQMASLQQQFNAAKAQVGGC